MPNNSIENKIRAGLPVIRLMQSIMPLSFSQRMLKRSTAEVRLKEPVIRELIHADGVPCDWIIPQKPNPDQVLLYIHGGGFVFGQTPQHLKMGAYLAEKMSTRILMVDYSLAPQHSFPIALNECVNVYQWLLKQGYAANKIAIAGDSAGGNLTITTMLKLRENGLPLPAAAVCLSPVTDLTHKEQPQNGFKDPVLPPKVLKFYTDSYLGSQDPNNPLISPLLAELTGLPPILVHVGEEEVLRCDAIRFVDKAQAVGVDARLEIFPHMWHVWQIFLDLPQAKQSLDEIAAFLKSQLDS
jgi:monoterpene epsilon-lactone hydrolase